MGIKDILKSISKLILDEGSHANRELDEARVLEHGKVKIEKGKPLNSNDIQSATVNSQVVGAAAAATFVGIARASSSTANSLFNDNHSTTNNQTNELNHNQNQNNELLQNSNVENGHNLESNPTLRSFLNTNVSGQPNDISSIDNTAQTIQTRGTSMFRDNSNSNNPTAPIKEQIPTQNTPTHNPDAPVSPTGDSANPPPTPNNPSVPVNGGTTNTTPNNPVPPEVAPTNNGTTPAASVDTSSGGNTDTGSGGNTATGGNTDTGSGGSTGAMDNQDNDDNNGKPDNHPQEDKMHTADDHASDALAEKDNFITEDHGEDNTSRSDEIPPPLPQEVSDHGQQDNSSHGNDNSQTVDQHASDSSSNNETLASVDRGQQDDTSHGNDNSQTVNQHASDSSSSNETLASVDHGQQDDTSHGNDNSQNVDHGSDKIHTADEHASDALAGKENFTTVDHGQTDVVDHTQIEDILNMPSNQGNEHSGGTVAQDWVNAVEDHSTASFTDNSGKSWTQEVEVDDSDKGATTDHGSDKATAKPFESTGEEHVAEDNSNKVDHSNENHG